MQRKTVKCILKTYAYSSDNSSNSGAGIGGGYDMQDNFIPPNTTYSEEYITKGSEYTLPDLPERKVPYGYIFRG